MRGARLSRGETGRSDVHSLHPAPPSSRPPEARISAQQWRNIKGASQKFTIPEDGKDTRPFSPSSGSTNFRTTMAEYQGRRPEIHDSGGRGSQPTPTPILRKPEFPHDIGGIPRMMIKNSRFRRTRTGQDTMTMGETGRDDHKRTERRTRPAPALRKTPKGERGKPHPRRVIRGWGYAVFDDRVLWQEDASASNKRGGDRRG